MAFRFTATVACGFGDESQDDCVMACVAESDDADAFSLMFLCDFAEPDASDVRLGMDTHCLVTPDQGTAYGCVRELTLDGDVLRVVLNPDSLEDLNLDEPMVEAVLRAPASDIAQFREVLPRVLGYGRADARPTVVGL